MDFSLKPITKYFLGSRVLFILFALAAPLFFPLQDGYTANRIDRYAPYITWIWADFDGRHFINIATYGYRNFDFAFFPLYPFLISLLGFGKPIYAGIVISCVSFFCGMITLRKLVLLDYKKEVAYQSLLFVSIFPVSFFYNSVYSDALFFFLAALSFYFARKKEWFFAGCLAGLACLTRLSGIALLPALAVEWFLQNKGLYPLKQLAVRIIKECIPMLMLGTLGLVGYMLYLQLSHGDFLLFQKSMVAWKQSGTIFPFQVVFRYLKIFFMVDWHLLVYWIAVLEFVSLSLYLTIAWYVWKQIRASYGLFMVVLLLLVPFTGTFAGTPRYALHLFPFFIALGVITNRNAWFRYILGACCLILGFILTGLFTRGYFVS